MRNKINEQRDFFTKETEIKNKGTEILELKNSMNEMKNAIESTCSREDQMEVTINDLEYRNVEIIQLEEERKLRFKKSEERL